MLTLWDPDWTIVHRSVKRPCSDSGFVQWSVHLWLIFFTSHGRASAQIHVVQVMEFVQGVVHVLAQDDDLHAHRPVRLEHLQELVEGCV